MSSSSRTPGLAPPLFPRQGTFLPVIKINAGARPVEEDVVLDDALGHLALEPEGGLFLVKSDLASQVVHDRRVAGVVAVRAKDTWLVLSTEA